MSKTAADRAAIADLIMRNMADGFREQRMNSGQRRMALNIDPSHEGAKTHAIGPNGYAVETGDTCKIDQKAWCRQPKGQHRHQTLPTGQGFRLAAMARQQHERVFQPVRPGIIEGGKLHAASTLRWLDIGEIVSIHTIFEGRQGRDRADWKSVPFRK